MSDQDDATLPSSPSTDYCLRAWPTEHPDVTRLQFIHSVLKQARENGFVQLPQLVAARSGESFVEYRGRLWQVETWVPGAADFHESPSLAKATAAAETLARFHLAVQRKPAQRSVPLAIRQRLEQLQTMRREIQTTFGQLRAVGPIVEFADLVATHFDSVRTELARWADVPLPQFPSIRDIWSDHVFFEGDEVTGFVDFGAMRLDAQVTDVARLLGSLDQGRGGFWSAGFEAYAAVRRLNEEVKRDMEFQARSLDRANALLAPYVWIRWLNIDKIQFDEPARAIERLERSMERLRRLGSPKIQ